MDRVCFPGFYFQHRGRETGPERHPGLEYNSIVAEGFSGPNLSAAEPFAEGAALMNLRLSILD